MVPVHGSNVYLASFLLLATYRAFHGHFDARHESVGASCDFPWTAMHRKRPLDSRTYICGDLWLALALSLRSGPILSREAVPTSNCPISFLVVTRVQDQMCQDDVDIKSVLLLLEIRH